MGETASQGLLRSVHVMVCIHWCEPHQLCSGAACVRGRSGSLSFLLSWAMATEELLPRFQVCVCGGGGGRDGSGAV